ncbi:MAG: hypothetical protein P4M04_11460 [Acidobacteriota bacterium]|nr:hypothetical protein [Acidobacteriota bacterium]
MTFRAKFVAADNGYPDTTYEYETAVNNQLLQNMRDAAQETGGELCTNSLDPRSCVQKALEDATDHYLLSYETHSRSSQPEWRQIRVKVNRPGVTVSARSGVMIAPSLTTEERKREQIAAALVSPVDLPGLSLELQPFPPHQPGKNSSCHYSCARMRTTQGCGIRTGWILLLLGLCLVDRV